MSSRAPTAAPGDLARFQDAFLRALLAGEQTIPDGATALPDVPTPLPDVATAIANGATSAPPVRATRESLFAHPGFAVYRNTVVTGCIDALAANYPAVVRLVGDEWFRAAAAVHVRRAPPSHPCLFDYGDGFAEFLAAFAPAAGLPYLPDIARLDRLWTEAHLAADEPPLDASRVAALAPGELARTVLAPHASARWAWFDRNPTWSIWRHARAGTPSTRARSSSLRGKPKARCWCAPATRSRPSRRGAATAFSSTPARPGRRWPSAPRPRSPPTRASIWRPRWPA
ncbi:MAG: DNA-binding domain-containing protein [Burkholderiaceae bacterium]